MNTTTTHLAATTGYSPDRLHELFTAKADLGPAVTHLVATMAQMTYDIDYAERSAREDLEATARAVTRALEGLDAARDDDGRWVASHATRASEAMAKAVSLAREFTKLAAVLDQALAA
jgi:hypothetical protein